MRYDLRKNALQILNSIDKNRSNHLIIHYSCESFYNITDGRSPRITSIAVYDLDSGQTDSFSIHMVAEMKHYKSDEIAEHYDELEKAMLDDYFNYLNEHKNFIWLHWNMRDTNYGFKAIEYRYKVLNGTPILLGDNKKIDIARLFIDLYGKNYISHPRMPNLIKKNIAVKDLLTGKEEASAFEEKQFIKLHQSTLRKVNTIADLIDLSIQRKLDTDAKWYDLYGVSFQGFYELCKDKWWLQLFIWLITLLIGYFLGKL